MDYFSDIEWVGFNHDPECCALVDKVFPDYYVIMYAHQGRFLWKMNDHPALILEAPMAWWTFPGPHFTFGRFDDHTTWDHRFASFRGDRVSDFVERGLLDISNDRPFKSISDPIRLCQQMDGLIKQLEAPLVSNARRIHSLEGVLLALHEEPGRVQHISPAEEGVATVIDAIKEDPVAAYDFHALAAELFISYTHFRRLFKALCGCAPQQFVIHARMELASRLLRSSGLEIKEVADRVGVEDIYYFSKMFKKTYGIPPGRFRSGAVNV